MTRLCSLIDHLTTSGTQDVGWLLLMIAEVVGRKGIMRSAPGGTVSWYKRLEVMMAMSASEARRLLFPLIEKVNDDQEAVEIVSKAGTAFLVPAEQWRSVMETQYLLRSPANARALLESIEQLRVGNVVGTTADELLAAEGDPESGVA